MNGVERSVPNFADTFKTAQRALAEQNRDALVDALREMSAQKSPPQTVDWQPFARAATILGEATLAITLARRYLDSAPKSSERQLYVAKTMTKFGCSDAALELLRDAIEQSPNDAALHECLGIEYLRRGALTEASQALRQSLAIQAAPSNAWLALSKVRTFADGDPEIAELEAALASSGSSGARGGMFYALGKMLDDAARHEEAFAAFAQGAALIGRESPYASARVKELLHETVAHFTSAFLAELDRSTIDSRKPVFVMGMPRSGTTLAEQILASHPGVVGGGEHFLLNCAAMGVPYFTPNAMRAYTARNAGGNAWTKVGTTYLRLLDDQFGQCQHVVDKSLAPFSVGAIAHIFPNARIIWIQRDPAAVA